MWSPTLFPWGNFNFPRSTKKIQFLDKISKSGKSFDLMKDLKYEHQSTFPSGGGSNLILGTGKENQIIILRTPAAIKFFHRILKNCYFGVKTNHYPPIWICMTHVWSHTLFPRGITTFQGVLTKFHFLTKFPHLEKIVHLIKDLKYEHQSTFPFWGRVKLNFRDRYGKPNIYSKNSSHCQVFSPNCQQNDTLT